MIYINLLINDIKIDNEYNNCHLNKLVVFIVYTYRCCILAVVILIYIRGI